MPGINIPELYQGSKWSGTASGTAITFSFITQWPTYLNDNQKSVYAVGGDVSAPGQLTSSQQAIILSILEYIQSITNITFSPVVQNNAADQVGQITFAGWTPHGVDQNEAGVTIDPPGPGDGGDVYIKSTLTDADFFHVALHEIGHALGLKHPIDLKGPNLVPRESAEPYTVMYQQATSSDHTTTYSLYDIAELQNLYGANTSDKSNNLYSFGGPDSLAMTIWDAGGDDTISAVGSLNKAIVNLNATKFSAIDNSSSGYNPNNPAFRIGIASGVDIENANGSDNGDILIGNKLSNKINGGAGNDLIFGDEVIEKVVIDVQQPNVLGWDIDSGSLFW